MRCAPALLLLAAALPAHAGAHPDLRDRLRVRGLEVIEKLDEIARAVRGDRRVVGGERDELPGVSDLQPGRRMELPAMLRGRPAEREGDRLVVDVAEPALDDDGSVRHIDRRCITCISVDFQATNAGRRELPTSGAAQPGRELVPREAGVQGVGDRPTGGARDGKFVADVALRRHLTLGLVAHGSLEPGRALLDPRHRSQPHQQRRHLRRIGAVSGSEPAHRLVVAE